MTPPLRKPASIPAKLSERQVTEQVISWLKLKGWTCIRLQSGLVRGKTGGTFIRLGEKGLPDWICVRRSKYFFLEMKATGKTPSLDQLQWIQKADALDLNSCWTSDAQDFIETVGSAWAK